MKWISAEELAAAAPYKDIVEALRKGFASDIETPVRYHHDIGSTTLLLMPAWSKDWTGLKTVTFKPDNGKAGLPTIQATYMLIDNKTGTPVVCMDGTQLTRMRTAAASALAADYLARKDAEVLVVIGAGALAPHFISAHASVRAIKKVIVVNRTEEKAVAVAKHAEAQGIDAFVMDAESAVKQADIVSCITASTEPLVKGAWLKPGAHVDLAGAFRPTMRETDGEVVARASVYVDTREGALAEAGDLIQAQAEGKFDFADVRGDLFDLCRGKVKGRKNREEITLFKSCGTGLEDLVTAVMVHLRNG
jgi:ornithine cyclodeaminase/alanine dehydrogenase-like protein (mu-crystallin family)